ncbi:MAG: type IX secretion system sortase PorU [Chitinophagaceae bacterium]
MFRFSCILIGLLCTVSLQGQRSYKTSSVLSTGNWYKIAVKDPGIYKGDLALLNELGITGNIPSASIRLFGNGGQMLPESCSGPVFDDLYENAIQMMDGGDGVFNGADYFLFYAQGPEGWTTDVSSKQFRHQKNEYSARSYFYITIGGTGKRIKIADSLLIPTVQVTAFNERYYYELDSVNFLSSGKGWYGEEFSSTPGKSSRTFAVPISNLLVSEPATLVSSCLSRSINAGARFMVKINNKSVLQHEIPGVGSGNFDPFARISLLNAAFSPAGPLSVMYEYQPTASGAQGWLDWFELHARRNLTMTGLNQIMFRDWNSVHAGETGEFTILETTSATQVWDITNALVPEQMKTVNTASHTRFKNNCSELREYIAFNHTGFLIPALIGKISNQDLHNSQPADLLIITHSLFADEARRLAAFHTIKDRMKVETVTIDQVYNEFSSGSPDPTAIRNFVKMHFDKAGNDTLKRPAYLLLFGDASYDYKDRNRNNTNLVPAYQSPVSLDPLATYTSDDYYGFLDDTDDINSPAVNNLLDIGIGRIPAATRQEAKAYVDKVIAYSRPETLGPWRNQLTFIADDEDFNLHVHDAEIITASAASANPVFIQDKIYFDTYRQESSPSGSRYPEVNKAVNDQIRKGTLIYNYNGHGSFRRLAEEVVLDQDVVNSWDNPDKLPLFVTATCDFAPFDNPNIHSLGENILLRPKTGAIALMTTTRLVFAYSNRIMNSNYLQVALKQQSDGSFLSLGQAVKNAKNITYQNSADVINNRKFTLLGDPALTLAFPVYQVKTNTINNTPVSLLPDTLKALNQYTITGSVTDQQGNILNNYNGTVYPVVYDKAQNIMTRSNDPESLKEGFKMQQNILFKGRSEVKNGIFSFRFVMPKDINYQFGNGKISYYTDNGLSDGHGSFTNFIIGGSGAMSTDNQGPLIQAYLKELPFTDGSITGESPVIQFILQDSSGINIVNTGIDHDITAMLDGDPKKRFVLNGEYETVLNSYQKGRVFLQLPQLEEGDHTIRIKAWDVASNSSELLIRFRVVKNKQLRLIRVMNYPNPFSSKTTFRFEYDRDIRQMECVLNIFTVSGQLVKSIHRAINSGRNRSVDIEWDGNTDKGNRILKGIYQYRITITTPDGIKAGKSGTLMVL